MLSKNKLNRFDDDDKTVPMIEYNVDADDDKTVPIIEFNIDVDDNDDNDVDVDVDDNDDNDIDDDDNDDNADDDDKTIPKTKTEDKDMLDKINNKISIINETSTILAETKVKLKNKCESMCLLQDDYG